MKKSNTFLASIIGTIVNGSHTIALIYLITYLCISLSKEGVDTTRTAVEIALYFAFFIVIAVALALSIVCLTYTVKNKDLTDAEGKRIIISTVFFDFFVAFLLFIDIFTGQSVLGIIFYIICCILLITSGGLYLIDYNTAIQVQKSNKDKIDNTASADSYRKAEEKNAENNLEKSDEK